MSTEPEFSGMPDIDPYILLAYLQNMRNNIANSDPCDRKADYEQGQSDFCNMMIRKLENGDFNDGNG